MSAHLAWGGMISFFQWDSRAHPDDYYIRFSVALLMAILVLPSRMYIKWLEKKGSLP